MVWRPPSLPATMEEFVGAPLLPMKRHAEDANDILVYDIRDMKAEKSSANLVSDIRVIKAEDAIPVSDIALNSYIVLEEKFQSHFEALK
jgi:uncharacterized membrane protein